MKNIYEKFALLTAALMAASMGEKMPSAYIRNKAAEEVYEVCKFLKCSPEELYEKCKNNPKLLSKRGNNFLESLIITRRAKK